MKKLLACIGLLAAVVAVGACGGSDDRGQASDASHVYRGTGYRLTTPDSWMNVTHSAQRTVSDVDLMLSPFSQGNLPSVNVIRESSSVDIPLADIVETSRQDLEASGYDVRGLEETKLALEPAQVITSRVTRNGRQMALRQVVVKHGGAVYAVTFAAGVKSFDHDARLFDAMLKSWRWR